MRLIKQTCELLGKLSLFTFLFKKLAFLDGPVGRQLVSSVYGGLDLNLYERKSAFWSYFAFLIAQRKNAGLCMVEKS